MKILVTGGAGFIGSHVVDALHEAQHEVVVLDDFSTGKREYIPHGVRVIEESIHNVHAVSAAIQEFRPQAIFHAAAHISVRESIDHPIDDAQTNIIATLHLLEAAREHGVGRFVFCSTGGAMYGDDALRPTPEATIPHPLSPYAITKYAIDQYCAFYDVIHGMSTLSLRFSNVYGPRQNPKSESGVVSIFTDALLKGRQGLIYGDGQQTRDFVYIDDAVLLIQQVILRNEITGILHVGTGIERTIRSVYDAVARECNVESNPKFAPAKRGEQRYSSLDSRRARQFFHWSPVVPFNDGIHHTVVWYRNQSIG